MKDWRDVFNQVSFAAVSTVCLQGALFSLLSTGLVHLIKSRCVTPCFLKESDGGEHGVVPNNPDLRVVPDFLGDPVPQQDRFTGGESHEFPFGRLLPWI